MAPSASPSGQLSSIRPAFLHQAGHAVPGRPTSSSPLLVDIERSSLVTKRDSRPCSWLRVEFDHPCHGLHPRRRLMLWQPDAGCDVLSGSGYISLSTPVGPAQCTSGSIVRPTGAIQRLAVAGFPVPFGVRQFRRHLPLSLMPLNGHRDELSPLRFSGVVRFENTTRLQATVFQISEKSWQLVLCKSKSISNQGSTCNPKTRPQPWWPCVTGVGNRCKNDYKTQRAARSVETL